MKPKSFGPFLRAIPAFALALGCTLPSAQSVSVMRARSDIDPALSPSAYVRVHDTTVDPTIRTYTGMVAALGAFDADGRTYTFEASPMGPRNFPLTKDDLRGWRLTMLTGKRFSRVLTVRANTESAITVTADKEALDGIAVQDLFVIESVDANGASLYLAPGAPRDAAAPGV